MTMPTAKTSISEEPQIRALVEARVAALHGKGAARLAATYASQIVKSGLAAPLQVAGPRIAEAAYWRPWLGSWTGPVTPDVAELGVTVGGDIAFCRSLNRMRGTIDGGGRRVQWFRATLGLRKARSAWKITHEYTSTPFYMDGFGRAATGLWPGASGA